jgi:phage terminase large subunit
MDDDLRLIAKGLMMQADYDQEWFLSAEAAIKGAWFGPEIAAASKAGRICTVPYDPALLVDSDWDIGIDDATAIWFSQSTRSGEVHVIDYYEGKDEGLPHYIRVLHERERTCGYVYGKHWGPHDIRVRDFGTGKSRLEAAKTLGLRFEVVPNLEFADGVKAVRLLLPRCWFDAARCVVGIESLRQYRRQFNARMGEFTGTPVHDRHSHAAAAFRGLAVRHRTPEEPKPVVDEYSYRMPSALDWTNLARDRIGINGFIRNESCDVIKWPVETSNNRCSSRCR